MRKWLEAGRTAALESWVWVLALLHTGCVADHFLTCSCTSPFILTKSQCMDFGVEPSESSFHLRSLECKDSLEDKW